ncbi:exodeoxyribonuclease 7 large subunit [Anaplasma platys]|uniref:Exodeoxyribonuclease 7 large subunit n=1 Tax=Anaplasma platys TaxID=949 RepID=A0A858PZ93_9RICK|nr:exodeoxyribonuclease VII large subunit [Anaplasma platys]QJC27925.1 exodeoxyribonuclease 7 large subunit [Anaplasma platys]
MRSFFTDAVPEFTVTEISEILQRMLHEAFYCVKVRGEIGGVSRPGSGHIYFTLKDGNSIINAVCWNGSKSKLGELCSDGTEVVCTGHISTYQSRYQLIIEDIVLAGAGKLAALLEERRKKLEKEGLFSPERKKKLPLLPLKIGVITSPTGAVIQDILSRVKQRFPTHVVIWPVQVQGFNASSMVMDAIVGFNKLAQPPDVLIVARGGGSLEDLWPFNDEDLARTVATSKIPIISAIGHETDFTIIDYAADLRAETPTAAVELVLPEKNQLVGNISEKFNRTTSAFERIIRQYEYKLLKLHGPLVETKNRVLRLGEFIDTQHKKTKYLLQLAVLRAAKNLENLSQRLKHYDHQHVLNIGYAIIRNTQGQQIDSAEMLTTDDIVSIELKDGTKQAIILS